MKLDVIKKGEALIPNTEESRVLFNMVKEGEALQIRVLTKDQVRTLEQNSGMWKLHSQFADQYGITKERAHTRFKGKFFLPIVIRDDEDGRLADLHEFVKTEREMHLEFLKRISTTMATPKQLSEAMDEYIKHSCSQGYYLNLEKI